MSLFEAKLNPTKSLQNSPIIQPKESDSSATGDMVIQCDNLLTRNYSTYDECTKLQEQLRSQVIEGNEEYKFLRSWLENANEDCLAMKPNQDDLLQIYQILLKNNFVSDFVEHATVRQRFTLKFISIMMQCKDSGKSLNLIDADVRSLKSEYQKLQNCETLLPFAPMKETIEYSKLKKGLRLKYIKVMYECKNLNICLNETYEKFVKLNLEQQELIRCFQELLQDATVKEFLNCANEKLKSELAEKTKKCECSKSSLNQVSDETIASFNLRLGQYEEKLNTEQRRYEQIEIKHSSMVELLHNYQQRRLPESVDEFIANDDSIHNLSVRSSSIPCNTHAVQERPLCFISEIRSAPELKNENNKKVDLHENDLILEVSNCEGEENGTSEKSDILPDNYSNSRSQDNKLSAKKLIAPDSFVEEHRIRNQDPMVTNELSSSSNQAELCLSTTQKTLSVTKVSYDWKLQSSLDISSSMNNKNFIEQSHEQMEKEWSYCTKCQKPLAMKNNESELKCSTCGILSIRENIVDPMDTTSTIDDPTSPVTNNNSVVENFSKSKVAKTNVQCDICNRFFSRKDTLKDHKLSIHERHEDYKCPVCGKILSRKGVVRKHLMMHFPQPDSINELHKFHGVDASTLKKNRQEVQITIQKKPLQSTSTDPEPLTKNLGNVQKAHKGLRKKPRNIPYIKKKVYWCAHCEQQFDQKRNMFHHICMEHFSGALIHFKCIDCECVFSTKQILRDHRHAYHNHFENVKYFR